MTGQELCKHLEALKALRMQWEVFAQQCYQYSWPVRGVMFGQEASLSPDEVQAQAKNLLAAMMDSTATDAGNILASSLVSGMTPAASRWFGWKSVEKDEPGELKDWLEDKATQIHAEIHASNYDPIGFEAMIDVVAAGMAAIYIDEGTDTPFSFELWPLHSCYFASTRRDGTIDTIFYCYSLTAQQAVKEYGGRVSEDIREAFAKGPYKRFQFFQAIFPKDVDGNEPPKKKDVLLPYASYHVELNKKRIVRSGGYSTFPVAVPCWLRLPNSVYAQGPMASCLADIKTLNRGEKIILDNAEWQMAGMWGGVDDGVLNPKTVRLGPKKLVMMSSKDSMFPLNPPGDVRIGDGLMDKKRASIRRILMADQLEPAEKGPAMTATEVHYRINLLRQLLGPMFGRIQTFLPTLVTRCFFIRLKQGKLGPLPPALRERTVRLQYISPLARSQQLEDVAAMDRLEQDLLAKEKFVPGAVDIYDWDEAGRKKAEFLGVPQVLVLDKNKVTEIRKIKEDRAAQAAQASGKPAGQSGGGMAGMGDMSAAMGA
ncbi:MAG TPA: phage tail protein [Geobacter sp.]|nr:phage tail protein [Geobacter sp.]